jgi:hypothetical protein
LGCYTTPVLADASDMEATEVMGREFQPQGLKNPSKLSARGQGKFGHGV